MDQQKKTLCIAGSMILPIAIGEPAVIMERDGGYRQTTTVLNMKKLSETTLSSLASIITFKEVPV